MNKKMSDENQDQDQDQNHNNIPDNITDNIPVLPDEVYNSDINNSAQNNLFITLFQNKMTLMKKQAVTEIQ